MGFRKAGLGLFLFSFVMFSAAGVQAGEKEDAKVQVEALNKQIAAAAEKGDFDGAVRAAEEAYTAALKAFGEKDYETAKAMNNLANLYLYMYNEKVGEAEQLYKRAILIEIEKFGAQSLEVADSYFNLAVAYAMQKKYDAARPLLDDVLKIRTEKLGAEHADTKKIQTMISEIWNAQHPNAETV